MIDIVSPVLNGNLIGYRFLSKISRDTQYGKKIAKYAEIGLFLNLSSSIDKLYLKKK